MHTSIVAKRLEQLEIVRPPKLAFLISHLSIWVPISAWRFSEIMTPSSEDWNIWASHPLRHAQLPQLPVAFTSCIFKETEAFVANKCSNHVNVNNI